MYVTRLKLNQLMINLLINFFIVNFLEDNLDVSSLGSEESGKPYKCPMCPSTFSHRGNLPRHIATIHEGKKRTDMPPKEKSDVKGGSFIFDEIEQGVLG